LLLENTPQDQPVSGPEEAENLQDTGEEQITSPTLPAQQAKVRYQVEEIVQIQSQRRMRSTEFHYIDHPKVGILAVIYPVEKPDLETEGNAPEAE
jgi:hypothetical protein